MSVEEYLDLAFSRKDLRIPVSAIDISPGQNKHKSFFAGMTYYCL